MNVFYILYSPRLAIAFVLPFSVGEWGRFTRPSTSSPIMNVGRRYSCVTIIVRLLSLLPGRLLRMDSRTSAAGDPETASQISRTSQHKPYMVLVASYGSFYLRMGAVCECYRRCL